MLSRELLLSRKDTVLRALTAAYQAWKVARRDMEDAEVQLGWERGDAGMNAESGTRAPVTPQHVG